MLQGPFSENPKHTQQCTYIYAAFIAAQREKLRVCIVSCPDLSSGALSKHRSKPEKKARIANNPNVDPDISTLTFQRP